MRCTRASNTWQSSRAWEDRAAVGLAEGLTKGTEGPGEVSLTTSLCGYTNLGGTLIVSALE